MESAPLTSDSPSTRRVLNVLQAIHQHPGARQSEIADLAGTTRPTVHRILRVLEMYKYVIRVPATSGYHLGLSIIELAEGVFKGDFVLQPVVSIADQVAAESLETVHVATFRDEQCRYAHKRESSQSLRVSMASSLGSVVPLHCTALGKSILAAIDSRERRRLIGKLELPRFTDHTITDPDQLFYECEQVARRGYAVDDEENENGIRCIAVAIRDGYQSPTAAISISFPTVRCPPEVIEKWGGRLTEHARQLETRIEVGPNHRDSPDHSRSRVGEHGERLV